MYTAPTASSLIGNLGYRPMMKGRAKLSSSVMTSLVILALAAIASGRLQGHGQQHGRVFDQIMHNPATHSGNGFFGTATHGED